MSDRPSLSIGLSLGCWLSFLPLVVGGLDLTLRAGEPVQPEAFQHAAIVLREAITQTGYDWKQDGPNMAESILAIMQKTGVAVDDRPTGRSYQRLDLAAALGHVVAAAK